MKKEFSYLQKDEQSFPIIDVELTGPKNSLIVKALVDSGASFSVFRCDIAEYLGINIESGEKMYLEGIGGRILGYLHKIRVGIDGKEFLCKMVFSPEFTVSFNLLGRNNFFLPFHITFKEDIKKLLLETQDHIIL